MERPSPGPPDNGSATAELAGRLLHSHYPYSDSYKKPRLFAGSLPDDPAFDVRIPAGF